MIEVLYLYLVTLPSVKRSFIYIVLVHEYVEIFKPNDVSLFQYRSKTNENIKHNY